MPALPLNLPPISVILRRLLLEDWGLKFISLILAGLMWLYIDGELTDIREVVVTLRPASLDLPQGWQPAPGRPMPRMVVRLRGPRRRLALVNSEMIAFQRNIPVEEPVPGRNALRVPVSALSAEGFEVVGVLPLFESDIGVELANVVAQDEGKTRVVRMKLPVRVLPPAGAAMKVEPTEVEVDVAISDIATPESDVSSIIVVAAQWPEEWGRTAPVSNGKEAVKEPLQPRDVPVRVFAPGQYRVTGIGGSPLPTVQARGEWVLSLK